MSGSEEYLYRHPYIAVKSCEFGFGVFATAFIPNNTMLEECHYIKYKGDDCNSPVINDYVFRIAESKDAPPEEKGLHAFVLGYGSIFNHSFENNTAYYHDTDKDVYVYYTLRDIEKDEQLFITYGKDWWESRDKKAG